MVTIFDRSVGRRREPDHHNFSYSERDITAFVKAVIRSINKAVEEVNSELSEIGIRFERCSKVHFTIQAPTATLDSTLEFEIKGE